MATLSSRSGLAALIPVFLPSTREWPIMPPAFVITLTVLMVSGPPMAMPAAAISALAPALIAGRLPGRAMLVDSAIAVAATWSAGLAYELAGGVSGLPWPWRTVPIAAAVLVYHLTQGALASVGAPLLLRGRVDRSWPSRALEGCSIYLLGGSVAALCVELIDHRLWTFAPVAAAVLFLASRTYIDYVQRLQEELRRREVIDHLDQGISVLDRDGRVTYWNDALERMLAWPAGQALGRLVTDIEPALAGTDLSRAVAQTLADGQARILHHVPLPAGGAATRVVQMKILPVADGVALTWRDVTEGLRAEQEIRQSGERLALAAEGANDGLWQWDLKTQEFYVSGRWRAMVGLPPHAASVRPAEWLGRVHPDDVADLNAALAAHLAGATPVFQHDHRIRHEDGAYRRFLCRGVATRGAGPKPDRIAGSLTDTTEHAIAQERLRTVGFVDALTGLSNRVVFVEELGRRLDDARRRGLRSGFAVLYLDLDRFKIVNDSLGHMVGDELLVAVSRRLETCLRQGDALARLGGDEFAIFLHGLHDDTQANAIAGRIQHALSAPFSVAGREVFTSASLGIAFGPADYTNPDEIMRDADTAMYYAKSRGKSRHEVFDAEMHARARGRLSLENDLRRAVAANDFEVHYQPIVSLASGMCLGFESLVRWTRNGEPISPAVFVPIAEELGLIESLGTWVLHEACRTFAQWQRQFPRAGLDYITVNVSSRQLAKRSFPRVVQQAVRRNGLRPADVRVEITETALLDSPGEAAMVLRELRDFGVKVYLDDFGTGYSSLSHLHNLPVDALKIDRSFVHSLVLPGRPPVVESILALARTLNTSVVAEGIENELQSRELERLGCTHAQGFLFSRPLSSLHAEQLIAAGRPLGPKGASVPALELSARLRSAC